MDFETKKAIYLQIADYVCEQILLEQWQEKIPSIRELAVNLQVNPNTVTRTYAFLEENRIIKMQRGVGYFIADNAYQQIIDLKKAEFLTKDLPKIFKAMELLNIDIDAVKQLYHARRNV